MDELIATLENFLNTPEIKRISKDDVQKCKDCKVRSICINYHKDSGCRVKELKKTKQERDNGQIERQNT